MSRRGARVIGALVLALALRARGAHAEAPATPQGRGSSVLASSAYATHAELVPGRVQLGERALYRAWVLVPRDESVRWLPPKSEGAFVWGVPSARRVRGVLRGAESIDTVRVEIPLQIFTLGSVSVPGIQAWLPYVSPMNQPSVQSLPVVHALVIPLLTAADSAADLKPLRGPLSAPWWEVVPWKIVFAAWLLVAAVIALIAWSRRRPKQVPKPLPVAPIPRRSPSAEALAELQALRRLLLPEHGKFSEHAMHLTRILKRYFEATTGLARPGDTTSEWVERMQSASGPKPAAARGAPEVAKLEGYLRLWDRIKFARAASSIEEAHAAELAVEEWVRPPLAEPAKDVA